MVGTIEPRKGYLQTIDAFTALWAQGLDANLVIFGKEGWKGLPDAMCSDIPQTVEKLRAHPELNNRPFWLEGISDVSFYVFLWFFVLRMRLILWHCCFLFG